MNISSNNFLIRLILNYRINNKYLLFLIYLFLKILFINSFYVKYKLIKINIGLNYPTTIINLLFIANFFKNSATSVFVYSCLNINSNFIDIGANEGNIVAFASEKIKAGKIYTFEPDLINFKKITSRFMNNSKVKNFNIALSDTIKSYSLKKNNFFKLRTGMSVVNKKNSKNFTNKLDNLIDYFDNSKIDLIKIDTEGHDYNVINGALSIIKKNNPILIVEINNNKQLEDIKKILPNEYIYFYKLNNKNYINTGLLTLKINKDDNLLGDVIISQKDINVFL